MLLNTMLGSAFMIKATKISIMEFLENPKNLFSDLFIYKNKCTFYMKNWKLSKSASHTSSTLLKQNNKSSVGTFY